MAEESKNKKDGDEIPFQNQVEELIILTHKLKRFGNYIIIGLIAAITMLALYVIFRRRIIFYENHYLDINLFTGIYALLSLLVGITFLFRFSQLKSEGMIIYEELTEEIDWGARRKEFIHRPSLENRIVIKEFLKSTDLPFTSGANGQAFYLILYLIVCVSIIIVLAL